MKIALLIILTVSTCLGGDFRIVNGKRIDLDSLGTNSPWRTIKIEALVTGGAYPKATASIEGESKVIHIKNAPAAITKAFSDATKLAADVVKLEAYVDAESKRLRRVSANIPSTAYTDSSGGSVITAYNNALVDLEEKRDRLETMQTQLVAVNAKAAAASVDRAYFTGQKYGGLEVWDYGIKSK